VSGPLQYQHCGLSMCILIQVSVIYCFNIISYFAIYDSRIHSLLPYSQISVQRTFSIFFHMIFLGYSFEGLRYISKLEEFENFVEKIRKYSLLCPTTTRCQRKFAIILIDDIPVTSGSVAFARLRKCLTGLIQSTQVPTVISLTHCHKSESNDTAMWNSDDLESLLQDAGAHKVPYVI
jgi:hypothetical protein